MTERFHTSVTERGTFRTCRRRWYYDVVERLTPRDQVQWNLIFGDVIHLALAKYYDTNRDHKKCHAKFGYEWKKKDKELREQYSGLYDHGIGDEWLDYRELGELMLYYYDIFDRTHKAFDKVIATNIEKRAFVEILEPEMQEVLAGSPLLSGAIDLVVERKDGTIWIWDHKTAASPPASRALEVDDQITGYCYLWYRMTGELPRGVYYNVLVKSPPGPPRLIKKGRELSQDKSQRTTYSLYLNAIEENGFSVSDYAEFLGFLSEKGWDQFFVREGMQRNEAEVMNWEQRLYQEYIDMEEAKRRPEKRYPNPGQMSCMTCPYIPLCQAEEEESDVEYLKENMYEIQKPRITIPKGV